MVKRVRIENRTGLKPIVGPIAPIGPPRWSYIVLEVQVHTTQHIARFTETN